MSIRHEDIEVILDFHIFDVQDFDLLVGQPIGKFLTNAPTQNNLEIHLGKETIFVQIAKSTNSMTEPSLDTEPIKEVKGILLVDSPESLLQKDVEEFLKEEDEPAEPIYISEFETAHRHPIEFEPLPSGLEKVVLDHDRDSNYDFPR